jgi:hypothetical protein
MSRSRQALITIPGAALALACGSAAPQVLAPAAPPEPAAAPTAPARSNLATSAELGGLDEVAAEQSFRDAMDGLRACIRDGAQRLEFIGGSIEFAVKVDATQHAAQVWAAESTLGERGTEKCMFDALRSVSWPAPQGGPYGIARNAFDFEPKKGVKVPAVWDAGRISSVLAGLDGRLSQCPERGEEQLLITLYIGSGGKPLGGGAASAAPVEDSAVDCVVDALLAANYPAPEHAPTKVRFPL